MYKNGTKARDLYSFDFNIWSGVISASEIVLLVSSPNRVDVSEGRWC